MGFKCEIIFPFPQTTSISPPLYHRVGHFHSRILPRDFTNFIFEMVTSARRRVAGVLLLYGAFSSTASATTCYSPGGYILVSFNYQPCYTNGTGPCCSSGDECLSNGMCFNAGANNLVSQSGCTDPTFTEPGCAIICTGPFLSFLIYADLL
jgi:hypothetical protein